MFLGIEAVLFGLFTAIMLWDQLDNVCRDSSYVAVVSRFPPRAACIVARVPQGSGVSHEPFATVLS